MSKLDVFLQKYDWVLALPKDVTFVAFDTETTGLQPETNKIVEIGAVKFTYAKTGDSFESLMDPEMPIPPNVSAINHITDDMVRGAPTGAELMPKLLDFIGDSVLIAHNAKFDINMVNAELDRLDLPRLKNRVIDTRWFAKDMYPNEDNYKLQTLAESLEIEVLNAHRADDDALVCMRLFLHCARTLLRKTLASRLQEKTA